VESPDTTGTKCLKDIQEVNLAYLLLARELLRENFSIGAFRLGLKEDIAKVLLELSASEVLKLAGSSVLLCSFRLNDHQILKAVTQAASAFDNFVGATR